MVLSISSGLTVFFTAPRTPAAAVILANNVSWFASPLSSALAILPRFPGSFTSGGGGRSFSVSVLASVSELMPDFSFVTSS